jgi:AraC-like DNA-binding protein
MGSAQYGRTHRHAPYLEHPTIPNEVYIAIRQKRRGVFVFLPHYHNEIEIICSAPGARGTVGVGETVHALEANEVFVVRPGIVHSFAVDITTPGSLIAVLVKPAFVKTVLGCFAGVSAHETEQMIVRLPDAGRTDATRLYRMVCGLSYFFQERTGRGNGSVVDAVRDAKILCDLFLALGERRNEAPPQAEPPQLLRRIIDTVEQGYSDKLTLEEIARRSAISTSRMCHYFRERTGMTVHDYLNQYRVRRAQALLRETPRSAAQIAMDCGFADPSYFVKVFSKYSGLSPKRWRGSARDFPEKAPRGDTDRAAAFE